MPALLLITVFLGIFTVGSACGYVVASTQRKAGRLLVFGLMAMIGFMFLLLETLVLIVALYA